MKSGVIGTLRALSGEAHVDAVVGADGDAARWVDDWRSGFAERAGRVRELSRRLACLTGTADSVDGWVEVVVDASGALTGLRLDERVRQWSAGRLACEILSVAGAARAELRAGVVRAVAETVGVDSATGRAVVAAFGESRGPGERPLL
jgi:hypothetical protein